MGRSPREPEKAGAVLVAAGESRRMGGLDKITALLRGKPLLFYSLRVFEECPGVGQVVLVVSPKNMEWARSWIAEGSWRKVRAICPGGLRRQDSVREGLRHLSPCRWVVIHDAARPCLEPELISKGLEAARETGCAVAAVQVKDTIKEVGADLSVVATLPRDQLWAVQTPQVFQWEMIQEAHQRVQEDVTDDAAMVERLGYRVKVFLGSYTNLKVTTPEDLLLADAFLRAGGAGRVG